MNRPVSIFLLIVLFVVFLIGVFSRTLGDSRKKELLLHPDTFYDEQLFYSGLDYAKTHDGPFAYHLSGGVLPHHIFPSFMISEFYAKLSSQNPKTIIIFGPNHYERGTYPVLSSSRGWNTDFGVVHANTQIIDRLIEKSVVKMNDDVLSNDHAVSSHMPFIRYYVPNARVVPILLSSTLTEHEVDALARSFLDLSEPTTVFIAAVDFSHYLSSKEAQKKDDRTLEVMKSRDFRQLFSFNNDYLDSPESIALLLKIMDLRGTPLLEVLHNTNSGLLQRNDTIETTSYFSLAFR